MLDVVITTPERIIFEGKAKSLILPGERGVFEILSFHKPLLSRLLKGKLIIDGKAVLIRRGIVGVKHNKATVIVEE